MFSLMLEYVCIFIENLTEVFVVKFSSMEGDEETFIELLFSPPDPMIRRAPNTFFYFP